MANEVTVVHEAEVLTAPTPTPNYNKKLGDNVLQISIKCKRIKDAVKKLDFNSVKGLKHITVIDEDGTNIGKRNRWLDVHFTKDAFKGVPNECEIHSAEDLVTGFLYVKAKYVQSPRVYQVKEDEETGEVKYPEIWIKGGIVGFEAYVSSQDEFNYVEAPIDLENGKLEDETSDDNEVEIK